jgi:hypothetical protein
MPKHPRLWFKPNSNECPSCLLVLNQLPCYFTQGTTQALTAQGYVASNIPKNSTQRHRMLDQGIFNDTSLPNTLYDHKLIRSLRKDVDLLYQERSETLSNYDPSHRHRAHLRAARSADSDMPLGILYSQEKPSIETRLHNALLAFSDKMDHLTSSGVSTTTNLPSYDATIQLPALMDRLNTLQTTISNLSTNGPQNISFNAKTDEIKELLTQFSDSIDSKLDLIRKEQAKQHSATMRYLEAKLALMDKQLQRSNAVRSSRSITPRPENRSLNLVDKPTNPLEAALSSARRPLSPESLPSHSRENSSSSIPSVLHFKGQRPDIASPPPTQYSSEQALFDEEDDDSDASSNNSAVTTSTMMTHNSVNTLNSVTSSQRKMPPNLNVWSCSDTNIQDWLKYLTQQSATFQAPQRSKRRSSEIMISVYDKYVKSDDVRPDFESKIQEAITSSVKERRKPIKLDKTKKSSQTKDKPSSTWSAFKHK